MKKLQNKCFLLRDDAHIFPYDSMISIGARKGSIAMKAPTVLVVSEPARGQQQQTTYSRWLLFETFNLLPNHYILKPMFTFVTNRCTTSGYT